MGFVNLHLHTEYSLLDGACRVADVLDRASELGQKAIAITDHGNMFGAVDFYKTAKSKNIKPIIGCEVYVASRSRFDKEKIYDSERFHLVLLCKNETGYKNLIKMVSESWINGFYVKPRIDKALLERYHEGLIALSACLAGEIPKYITNGDYESALDCAKWYQSLFGEDYYLEMQNHGIEAQLRVNDFIRKISAETGIKTVVTNDVHYVRKENSKIQQVLICIQTNNTLGNNTGLEFETDEFYLKSYEEMLETFPDDKDAVEITEEIAEKCNLDFEFGNTKLPHFEVPDGENHFHYLKRQCEAGLVRRYGENPPEEYRERLNYELDVIERMGYTDYYLIVNDFISYAKNNDIPVGPGRGSGAGSLAAYCIGITGIDPMKYNLIFERFLNPERVSMPDFDVDFCYMKRPQVIYYVIEKYGVDHVAQIITFGTMAAKGALRDVGRALGMPYAAVDKVAKLVPNELNITLDLSLEKNHELKDLYETNNDVKELIDTARMIEGMPRHASTHAAGVVITRDSVDSYVPLATNDDCVVTQYIMTTLEELGLLKIDFLGLRYLTVIDDCVKMIRKNEPSFDIEKIDLCDKKTYEMISKGLTDGVFQLESSGMKSVLNQLKPERIEDIIAVISLYRPGPMKSIPKYIENRHNPEKIKYPTPLLKDILDVTYGCIVYQEQVMQIFRTLAGYSFGRADIVRRAMSKKKHKVMEMERKNFIYGLTDENGKTECVGAVKNGVDEKTANMIFDSMSDFSQYAFNKSHAACYAFLAYRTAYLKCHYPKEYFASLISSVLDNTNKTSAYIAECLRLKIKIAPPDINKSFDNFTVCGNDIQFGLLGIKNLGRNVIKKIIDEREENGKYQSFQSFCSRIYSREVNKRAIEALVYCGALDGFGLNRRQMISMIPYIMTELENKNRYRSGGQLDLFGGDGTGQSYDVDVKVPDMTEFEESDKLAFEKEYAGIYVTGHPLSEYYSLSNELKCDRISDILSETENESVSAKYKDGVKVTVLGIISSVRRKITRNNESMAFVEVEDVSGSAEMLVFPKTYEKCSHKLNAGKAYIFSCRLSVREDEDCKLLCEFITDIPEKASMTKTENKISDKGLYIKFSSENCAEYNEVQHLLDDFDGTHPVFYYFTDTKKLVKHSSRHVLINEELVSKLKMIVGEGNVGIK